MELLENLFIGENITDPEAVIVSLRRQIPVLRLYCIVYFADKDRLELLSSHELFRAANRHRPAKVAGIAMGREKTVELLLLMARKAQAEGRNPADPQALLL